MPRACSSREYGTQGDQSIVFIACQEAPPVWLNGAACAVLWPHECCAVECQQVAATDVNRCALMGSVLCRGPQLCCRWPAKCSCCHQHKSLGVSL